MAGLFDPSFRGAGSPGAPGVGSTQRGLQLVEQGKNTLATQGLDLERAQAQQPALLQEAELDSVIQTAQGVGALQNRQSQLDFLTRNKAAIEERGGDSTHTDDGIRLLQQGAYKEFDESIGELVTLGEKLAAKGRSASSRAFAPQTIRKVVGKDDEGNDVFGLFSRQTIFNPATNKSTVNETRIEGDLVTATGETISQQRVEEVKLAEEKKSAEVKGAARGKAKVAPLIAKTEAFINSKVKLAEKEAIARGETLTDLARAEAALPGLRDAMIKRIGPCCYQYARWPVL